MIMRLIYHYFFPFQLMDLGYSADLCTDYYVACGKNEDIAANLLLQNTNDDEEQS